ncbi:hypothetical protein K470DRAFT_143096 [Piedraia hortae CBS 480.64]|uniref:Uncharacterized protein n=1 Tax=Piedraia hortae CBS 480.64 TaxID=1314780 RepID=A0A6A7C7N1_9PEZI|nr:hypothetical protein K470DRAFT_143096 [Piedraia hortae CBS 480.64]
MMKDSDVSKDELLLFEDHGKGTEKEGVVSDVNGTHLAQNRAQGLLNEHNSEEHGDIQRGRTSSRNMSATNRPFSHKQIEEFEIPATPYITGLRIAAFREYNRKHDDNPVEEPRPEELAWSDWDFGYPDEVTTIYQQILDDEDKGSRERKGGGQ